VTGPEGRAEPATPDDVVRHLQAAARELIAAARAALDVAETMVDDPTTLVEAVSVLTELGRSVIDATRPGEDARGASRTGPRVQHIRVS
jgi:hypothetical protein